MKGEFSFPLSFPQLANFSGRLRGENAVVVVVAVKIFSRVSTAAVVALAADAVLMFVDSRGNIVKIEIESFVGSRVAPIGWFRV